MKQIFQDLSNGAISVEEIPIPKPKKGHILISSSRSLISKGTEKMLLDFGKSSYISKALKQPEKVNMVIDKIKADGISSAFEAVSSKLSKPLPLGYCNAGRVIESSESHFKVGDRVVSNGNHAEVVRIPKNLCAKIPDSVDDDSASFTVLGAISLQGVRLVNPSIGECIVVYGLGLVGLLTVQILKANGCRVLGVDYNSSRCSLAKDFGAEVVDLSKNDDLFKRSNSFSRNRGVDAVLITASTKSNEVIENSAKICRKRARIVLVGVVGLDLKRDDFYEKEITFQVSSSYGPGRYDPIYEEKGYDYPLGFVRWTEQRNFEAILDMMAEGKIDTKPLITNRFSIDDSVVGYKTIEDPESLGILIDYPLHPSNEYKKTITLKKDIKKINPINPKIAIVGAGNYASRFLIPAFKKANANLNTLISSGGLSGTFVGKKFGFEKTSTDINNIFEDKSINAIVIATKHNTHAKLVSSGIANNKNIFVEKPLCLNLDELEEIKKEFKKNPKILAVGFNRRFSKYIKKIDHLLGNDRSNNAFVMTVNAGAIDKEHWTQDIEIGGGRVLGEACHFIDLLRFLAKSPISDFSVSKTNSLNNDDAIINLEFSNGTIGSINYFSNGNKKVSKERLEVFSDGRILIMDNYRSLKGYGFSTFNSLRGLKQDKGQEECVRKFVECIENDQDFPIKIDEIFEVAEVSIRAANK